LLDINLGGLRELPLLELLSIAVLSALWRSCKDWLLELINRRLVSCVALWREEFVRERLGKLENAHAEDTRFEQAPIPFLKVLAWGGSNHATI
jgi:hypothetical protein